MSNQSDLQAHATAHQAASAGSIAATMTLTAASLSLVKFLRVDCGLDHTKTRALLVQTEQTLEYSAGGL